MILSTDQLVELGYTNVCFTVSVAYSVFQVQRKGLPKLSFSTLSAFVVRMFCSHFCAASDWVCLLVSQYTFGVTKNFILELVSNADTSALVVVNTNDFPCDESAVGNRYEFGGFAIG